jgi:chorismate-pyruvate lyase
LVRRAGSCDGRSVLLALLAGVAGGASLAAPPPPDLPDTPSVRRTLQETLQTLNAELLSHDSATVTLEHWCGQRHLAEPAQVIAHRVQGIDKPVSDEQRKLLQVGANEPVRYRHVQLSCGAVVLSEADNWYVPGRLTAQMNAQLDASDTPFGKVVSSLHFQRHTLSAVLLWQPWPEGGDQRQPLMPPPALEVPAAVLEHRALLTLPDGTPFSEVVETYTGKALTGVGDEKSSVN